MIILPLMSSQISRRVPCIGAVVGKYSALRPIVIKSRSSVGKSSAALIINDAIVIIENSACVGNSATAIII